MQPTPIADKPKPRDEQFTLTLRALPGDLRPAAVRLRQLLKLALRGFKLRCESVTPDVGDVA
jgi:hypothetical protein